MKDPKDTASTRAAETAASTIFALSSGHGRAGVAVIRVSGPMSGVVLDRMAAPRPKPRFAGLRKIQHPETGEVLDEALVLWFPAPRSETGEDMAELQVHGGGAVVRAVLGALGCIRGCRPAEAGEFARRAFENGRLDLTAVEGLADLVDAETEAQRRQALVQAGGELYRLYDGWRGALLEALALTEAAIDFSDEGDVAADAIGRAAGGVEPMALEIEAHLTGAHRGEIVREGFRVVLAGAPNAGKSSLINALTRREVAIVSPEAGTTRDVIEVRLDIGGYAVVLADTAGLREARSGVEQEGIRRTLARSREADLVLWVVDATAPVMGPPAELAGAAAREEDGVGQAAVGSRSATARAPSHAPTRPTVPEIAASQRKLPVWMVLNKVDLVEGRGAEAGLEKIGEGTLHVSAKTGAGLAELARRIGQEVEARVGSSSSPSPPASQARHREHLGLCVAALRRFLAGDKAEAELRAEDLRIAADALGRITGRIGVEDVLGVIFGRFCIGK